MQEIKIPGFKLLQIEHLVLDYNGTLACDGGLLTGVAELLETISAHMRIHVLTADTFGGAASAVSGISCEVTILEPNNQDVGKAEYVRRLGEDRCICIGNGRNDRLMLRGAALGIAVVQEEGAAGETLAAADVVATDILAALRLILNPRRLVATLRT